ncbi:MAG TPA: ABC transporter substrate-binding protein [Xanthobacteraceae bacterium]|nr:ABC transporter substrate-binding protein [Xanthobacteraceae bacterium]
MWKFAFVIAAALALAASAGAPVRAAEPVPITIVVFNPPSLGAMFPAVIKQQKFDIVNGIDITFVERPPDAYAAQFNSGEFEVGGSASVLILGLGASRGIKTSYLFNLFDYWGTVVSNRPEIKVLADLKGKELAAAKGTTNYTMFAWLAKQQGVDPEAFQVINTATPGLVGYALADRADAVQLWEPAYTLVKAERPDIHTIDLNIAKVWRAFAGGSVLPYLGVAAHQEWIDHHRDVIAPLYRSYRDAAAWVLANPAAAAPLVATVRNDAERQAVAALIRDNSRLALNLQPAGKIAAEIEATYKAGIDVGLFKDMPPASSIYSGGMQ